VKKLLVPINDTSTIIGVGRTKIYELIARGDLQRVKLDGKSLITLASIEKLVAALIEGDGHDR
jgi:hypothetical protein